MGCTVWVCVSTISEVRTTTKSPDDAFLRTYLRRRAKQDCTSRCPSRITGSTFLSSVPVFTGGGNLSLRFSVFLLDAICTWTRGTDGMIMTRKTRSARKKNLSQWHLPHIIPHGLTRDRASQRPLQTNWKFLLSNAPRFQEQFPHRWLTFYSLPVTWCTNSLTFNNCTFCPLCIYVFCIYLRTNSDLCHLQHKLIGFYNRDEKCLLRGTNWVFK